MSWDDEQEQDGVLDAELRGSEHGYDRALRPRNFGEYVGQRALVRNLEVFIAAAMHIDQLRDRTRLRPWLYSVMRNKTYDRIKARRRAVPR